MNPADDIGAAFATFSARVKEEPALFEQLEACQDIQKLEKRAVELGRAQGLVFTPLQVREAWFAACRSWHEPTKT